MANEIMKEMIETFTASLDTTQRNATDIGTLAQQVANLSNQDSHSQVIAAILADSTTGMEQKVDLILKVDSDFDRRVGNNTRRVMEMQTAQTQNTVAATSWWAENWTKIALGAVVCVVLAGSSPHGRKTITSAATRLLAG